MFNYILKRAFISDNFVFSKNGKLFGRVLGTMCDMLCLIVIGGIIYYNF